MDQRSSAKTPGPPTRPLVVGVFGDEVRAEQAVRALEVWRGANRRLGVGPIGVVARYVSGTVAWRARGVTRPRRGALIGLLAGLVLFALPTAGAVALAVWVLASVVFGVAGLFGAVPSDQVGGLATTVALLGAGLVGLLVGLVGALLGCLIGLLVGFIDSRARGLSRSEVAQTASALAPGAWAAVARVEPAAEPLVRDELTRLGGAPAAAQQALPQRETPVPAGPRRP